MLLWIESKNIKWTIRKQFNQCKSAVWHFVFLSIGFWQTVAAHGHGWFSLFDVWIADRILLQFKYVSKIRNAEQIQMASSSYFHILIVISIVSPNSELLKLVYCWMHILTKITSSVARYLSAEQITLNLIQKSFAFIEFNQIEVKAWKN